MIKPIDIQTIFLKMNEVGKEQNQQKELAAMQQSQEAKNQIQKEIMGDHSVNQARQDGESEKIKDKESEASAGGQEKENKERKNKEKVPEEELVKAEDPDLGQHIDITG